MGKKVVIVGLGEAGKSCYRILAPIKELEVKQVNHIIKSIDTAKKTLHCDKISYEYDFLVLCTGASPRELEKNHPNIKTTRDFNSIQQLAEIAKSSNRIAVLGNGGVSLEVVNEFRSLELLWIFKDSHIGKDFLDEDTSKYFYPYIFKKNIPCKNDVWAYLNNGDSPDLSASSMDNNISDKAKKLETPLGPALGPVWKDSFRQFIKVHHELDNFRDIRFEPSTTLDDILSSKAARDVYNDAVVSKDTINAFAESDQATGWEMNDIINFQVPPSKIKHLKQLKKSDAKFEEYPLFLKLKNGNVYGVDYLICGLGVVPNTSFIKASDKIKLSEEGGIIVDNTMKSSIDSIYAAGDVATIMPIQHNFIQKRLWSQARVMGIAAAQSIIQSVDIKYTISKSVTSLIHFCMLPALSSAMITRYFNNFVHVTSFFGLRAVFLGKYNGQGLKYTTEFYSAGNGLVKYVKMDGKVRGAILIGETGMEVSIINLGLH
eukprot:NODE_22_length_38364_cov_0.248661.p7 type:complete len:488 gc:universal NODE_22_length_38364_cov_0.248661:23613-25076(+)